MSKSLVNDSKIVKRTCRGMAIMGLLATLWQVSTADGSEPPQLPLRYANTTLWEVYEPSAPLVSSDGTREVKLLVDSPLPNASAPSIQLSEVSMSPTMASRAGYASYERDLMATTLGGYQEVATGGPGNETTVVRNISGSLFGLASKYRYETIDLASGVSGQDGSWQIRFPDVPGFPFVDPQNFFPEELVKAQKNAIAALRINPFNREAYAALLQSIYEGIVPMTYAGNEWLAKADELRILPKSTINQRISTLETARQKYRNATDSLYVILNHPTESAFLWEAGEYTTDLAPVWARTEDQTWPALVANAYLQAVEQLARVEFQLAYSRYLRDYRPLSQAFEPAPLIEDIENTCSDLQLRMIVGRSIARRLGVSGLTENQGVSSDVLLLRRLAENVASRNLFFAPGDDPFESGEGRYAFYGPYDIPFVVPTPTEKTPFAFDNLIEELYGLTPAGDVPSGGTAQGGSLIAAAKAQDLLVQGALDTVLKTAEQYSESREKIRSNSESELGKLCGMRRDPVTGNLLPDLLEWMLPPGERTPPNIAANEDDGDVGFAWNGVDQAETRLRLAIRGLEEIFEEESLIREFGAERLKNIDRRIDIRLSTGEKLAGLDVQAAAVRAEAEMKLAEVNARAAKRSGFLGGLGKAFSFAAKVGLAVTTGGTSLTLDAVWQAAKKIAKPEGGVLAAAAGVISPIAQGHAEAGDAMDIGKIKANSDRRLGEIAAQRSKVQALEAADMLLVDKDDQENMIEESVQRLLLRVEGQRLEILLAEQQLDLAEMELAANATRISYLLQEYRRATIRVAANTLNRPDVRNRRDFDIIEAERIFRNTQEFAYLASKAAEYRFYKRRSNGQLEPFYQNILSAQEGILRAQNAIQLQEQVSNLLASRSLFLQAVGGFPPMQQVRISLRDHVFQANDDEAKYSRNLTTGGYDQIDDVDNLLQPFPFQKLGLRESSSRTDRSLEHFRKLIRERLELTPGAPVGSTSRTARIAFALGFAPTIYSDDATVVNPLRTDIAGTYGHVIWGPGTQIGQTPGVGVFINLLGAHNNSTRNAFKEAVLLPNGVSTTLGQASAFDDFPVPLSDIRVFNPATKQTPGRIVVAHNEDLVSNGRIWANDIPSLGLEAYGSQLHERPPGNSQWILEMTAPESQWNNLLNTLHDIEIGMTLIGWNPGQ